MIRAKTVAKAAEVTRLMVSPRLIAICLAGSFMLVVGAVLSVSYLFLMAGAILSIPLVGYIIAAQSIKHLTLERTAPTMVEEGEEFDITLTVFNQGLLPRLGIRVLDRLPSGLETPFSRGNEMGVETFAVCSQESQATSYGVRACRRGSHTLSAVDVTCEDLLGIFHVRTVLRRESELLVYPRAAHVDLFDLLASGSGDVSLTRQPMPQPEGSEIRGIREYFAGDDLRRIHWPTTARAGELAVVEFEEAPRLQAVVMVATSSVTPDDVLDCCARVARGISDTLLRAGITATLLAGGETVTAGDADGARLIYAALARMKADSSFVAEPPMQGMPVILISGRQLDGLSESVRRLAARGPLSLVIVDPEETDAPHSAGVRNEALHAGANVVEFRCERCAACEIGNQ